MLRRLNKYNDGSTDNFNVQWHTSCSVLVLSMIKKNKTLTPSYNTMITYLDMN